MKKASRARHALEFKLESVRLVEGGQSIAAVARALGMVDQTLCNWFKGAGTRAVSAELMELSRLRTEPGPRNVAISVAMHYWYTSKPSLFRLVARVARTRYPVGQGASAKAYAAAWHPGQRQAPL